MPFIGDLIREARERAGMTQAELARRLGTDQPSVSRWEQGKRTPRRLDEIMGILQNHQKAR